MKCIICHKTEEDFINANSDQNLQIEKIIKIINEKIINSKEKLNTIIDGDDRNRSENINDYSNLCESINNEKCKICTQGESIDNKGYYWCNKYNKSFKTTTMKNRIEEELLKLENEIKILESRKDALKNIKFKDIKIDGNVYDTNYEKFNSIIKKYGEEESANKNFIFKICPYCESLIKKIVEETVYDIVDIDEIIEKVKFSIEDNEDEEE
jgi:hypothetical protein